MRRCFVISTVAYNQPYVCPSAAWNPDAITIFNDTVVGPMPTSFFIDRANSIYVVARNSNQLYIRNRTNHTSITNISSLKQQSWSIFVTSTKDVYFEITDSNSSRIDKLSANTSTTVPVLYTSHRCFEIFVDIYDNLHCSMSDAHQVIRHSIDDDDANDTTVIAGNGTRGAANNMLACPRGIFVTQGLHLFVADCANNRVQLFRRGQTVASTFV